jgi:polyisoprenoid-binding protein YceI
MIRMLVFAAVVAVAPAALGSEWDFDPTHSTAQFSVRHMMVTDVHGEFGKLTGRLVLDDKDATRSQVEASIDASTINTREPKRDAHLKSADFFDVEKNPRLTFKSATIKKTAPNKFLLSGDLTMRGVTKPVTFDVELTSEIKSPMGDQRRGAHATAKIKRKDWGLNWNKTLEAGGVLVGDDVTLTLDVELVKKAEPAAAK